MMFELETFGNAMFAKRVDILLTNALQNIIADTTADNDNDGMPDYWEILNGLSILVNDANADSDGDGYSNLQEFLNDTDPNTQDIGLDVTAPVISLIGEPAISIVLGTPYIELGAIAQDNIDGNITPNIVIGGDIVNTEQESSFTITYNVTDNAGNVATEVTRTITVTSSKVTKKLNDTGITWGGNYPSGSNADCTGETIGEQDCAHGRDALAAAGQLSKVGGGMAGFDFTKLDANGNPLPNQNQNYATQPWACVKDNHTGLIWEVKIPDAQGTHLHSMNDSFNWYNTQDFVNRVNSSNGGAGLCGATDWRMPNLHELKSIVHLGKFSPAIDENYFPNSGSSFYWSSSPHAVYSIIVWGVNFNYGYDNYDNRSSHYRVRLVRGGQ